MIENDTIAAVASGVGGAVTLIRVSGGEAIAAGDRIFRGVRGRRLADARGFTILYGTIRDGETVVDEVLVSVFRAPHSYTGEDMIEVSCHASAYIQREVMRLLVESGRPNPANLRCGHSWPVKWTFRRPRRWPI